MVIRMYSFHGYSYVHFPWLFVCAVSMAIRMFSFHGYSYVQFPWLFVCTVSMAIRMYSFHGYSYVQFPWLFVCIVSMVVRSVLFPVYSQPLTHWSELYELQLILIPKSITSYSVLGQPFSRVNAFSLSFYHRIALASCSMFRRSKRRRPRDSAPPRPPLTARRTRCRRPWTRERKEPLPSMTSCQEEKEICQIWGWRRVRSRWVHGQVRASGPRRSPTVYCIRIAK